MTAEQKVKTFEKEIDFIKNDEIKNLVKIVLEKAPDYFFTIPASSTGKYHPKYALGDGGLVRHTKAAVRIAKELFVMYDETNDEFSQDEKDIIIASLILHDSCKNGFTGSKYTDAKHPIHATKLIESVVKEDERFTNVRESFSKSPVTRVLFGCIGTHMGRWTKDFKTRAEVLMPPRTKLEKFVHLADYIASRKCLEFNFEV